MLPHISSYFYDMYTANVCIYIYVYILSNVLFSGGALMGLGSTGQTLMHRAVI